MSETQSTPIGLASNPDGKHFECGNCKFFKVGYCLNKNPLLNGRRVEHHWCCNLFKHSGMKVIQE